MERLLPKGTMITGKDGISYYQIGKKYFSSTGWLQKEITFEKFKIGVESALKDLKIKKSGDGLNDRV